MKNTGPDKKTAAYVKGRDQLCRRCHAHGEQIHHRQPRGLGGSSDQNINSTHNLVWLCFRCHSDIESHRAEAYEHGWLVRRPTDPASVPVVDVAGREIYL